jgi:hypothetical protein
MKPRPLKVLLRIYKHEKTLEREFSSYDEAQRTVEQMITEHPDLIVEPYVQLSDSCEIDISEIGTDECADCAEGWDSESPEPGKS